MEKKTREVINEEVRKNLMSYFERGTLYNKILNYCAKKYNISIPKIDFVSLNPFDTVSNFCGGFYLSNIDTVHIDAGLIEDQEIMCVTLAQIMVRKYYARHNEPDGFLVQIEGTALGMSLICRFGIMSERMKKLYLNNKGNRFNEIAKAMYRCFLETREGDSDNECV